MKNKRSLLIFWICVLFIVIIAVKVLKVALRLTKIIALIWIVFFVLSLFMKSKKK